MAAVGQRGDRIGIGQVDVVGRHVRQAAQPAVEDIVFPANEVIDQYQLDVGLLAQSLGQVIADETGGAGDHDARHRVLHPYAAERRKSKVVCARRASSSKATRP